ncbi:MAG: CinA family protein [Firmicutes bacterium]|nr:CinA family protein [[Eubacterium] siraeum]MCM1488104.1 CinA family protein [Bacillota bacterium]
MKNNIDKQAENVVQLLLRLNKKTAAAESCTGGLISAAITSVGGSSGVFDMGICSYANIIKQEKLGVPAEALEKYGAVSMQVAMAMAEGVMLAANSDFAVSTTGIAGPSGGTAEKPVGTVWIGVCSRNKPPKAEKFLFKTEGCPEELSEREFIRRQAVLKALIILENEIKEEM